MRNAVLTVSTCLRYPVYFKFKWNKIFVIKQLKNKSFKTYFNKSDNNVFKDILSNIIQKETLPFFYHSVLLATDKTFNMLF